MILQILQIIVAVAIVILILLQERSAGLSGIFGGGDGGGFYQTRRGLERIIFIGTIVLTIVFVALALAQLFGDRF
jgi:protein translocase SecG subunit